MKKRLFVLAFALAFTLGLAWAGGDHGQMDIAGHVAKLKTDLKLTDQQAEKVRAVLEDMHKRKMEAKEKAGGQDTPELREQVNKLMAERDARFKEILTPQQFTQYQELQAKQAKEHAAAHKK